MLIFWALPFVPDYRFYPYFLLEKTVGTPVDLG